MTHCTECGEARVRTPSGYVCPNGHGRIVTERSMKQAAKNERFKSLNGLPLATELTYLMSSELGSRKRFIIAGHVGIWRRLMGNAKSLLESFPTATVARRGNQKALFVRDRQMEEEVLRAMGRERAQLAVPREQ